MDVRGDVQNAYVLAGASLGSDGQLGGEGDATDFFHGGSINHVSVQGNVNNSVIAAGLDPMDGTFGNGDDYAMAGSIIKVFEVAGKANRKSLFAADSFPARTRIDGQGVDTATDRRFFSGGEAPAEDIRMKLFETLARIDQASETEVNDTPEPSLRIPFLPEATAQGLDFDTVLQLLDETDPINQPERFAELLILEESLAPQLRSGNTSGSSFDPAQYLASHGDLILALGYDLQAAEMHWHYYGETEGRSQDAFDEARYLASHTDLLQAFGSDVTAATQHYILYGYAEGRPVDTFDAGAYLASNPDLIPIFGSDLEAATQHYIEFGFTEQRPTDAFDAAQYLASHLDLLELYGLDYAEAQAYNLINDFTRVEGSSFDASLDAATLHYIQSGNSEGRTTDAFDEARYLASYGDLITFFNQNPADASYEEKLQRVSFHYVMFGGKNEQRQADIFSAQDYLLNNPDLQPIFGTDYAAATRHYVEFGYAEGRRVFATPTITAALINDTGSSATDGITNDAAISGTVSDPDHVETFQARLNGGEPVTVTPAINPDGTFTLPDAELAKVYRGALLDGVYQLELVAQSHLTPATVPAIPYVLTFTLDTQAPELELETPLAEGDHSSWARLTGSVNDGELPGTVQLTPVGITASLNGAAAQSFTVTDGQFDQVLSNGELADGNYTLELSAQDVAGNSASQTVTFTVADGEFITEPTNAQGWAAATDEAVVLGEQDGFVVQKAVTVNLKARGEDEADAVRKLSFEVETLFDTSGDTALQEDRLAVYLVDPNDPTTTLLDSGEAGSAIFALAGDTSEFRPGLVRFDGSRVEIDLSGIEGDPSQVQLVFQLLNHDGDSGSSVRIGRIDDVLDVDANPGLLFPLNERVVAPGEALSGTEFDGLMSPSQLADTLSPSGADGPDVELDLAVSDVRLDVETGRYLADVTVRNLGDVALSRKMAVVFSNLPSGVTLENASGTDAAGNPYINLTDAIRNGGLDKGAVSDVVQVELNNPGLAKLDLQADLLLGGVNQAPSFDPVGPLSVTPGGQIEIDLVATDPDGDLVTFSIKAQDGTEIPTGKLDGNGKLTFAPTPEQVGSHTFTLIATDGLLKTEQTVTLDVLPDPIGTTRISGRVLDIDGTPLADMPIQLGRLSTDTDSQGYFTVALPPGTRPADSFNIPVARGDASFDPFNTGQAEINLRRTVSDRLTGDGPGNPLRHPNQLTSFIDSSAVYGSDTNRAAALRTNDGTGRLKVSDGDLLPFNNETFFPDGTLENSNNSQRNPNTLFAAGDVRANENPGLIAMHTLLVREHNRLADALKVDEPSLTGEELYQRARQMVTAQIQHITYNEYLPLLIGDVIPEYSGYDDTADPSISHLFTAAAFRIGHTQGFGEFLLVDENDQQVGAIPSTSATFNPDIVTGNGIEPILRGLADQQTQQIDTKVIDEIRNLLFGPPGAGGIDLAAVDIQRGRDVGLPDYNTAREDMGLTKVTSFDQITDDPDVQAALENTYGTVDDIDVIVGGLAEDHVAGAMVGKLFQEIMRRQFVNLRDGDRFWYENGQLSQDDLDIVRGTTLADLIRRNTTISTTAELPDNVFMPGQVLPDEPTSGTAATTPVTEYASIDGSGNNLTNPDWGKAGENLGVDGFFTQQYGDGISTPAGADRPSARTVSNNIFAQDGDLPDAYGASGFMLMWSQFVAHDMVFSPGGSSDTLKFLADEIDGNYPFIAEKVELVLGHEVYEGFDNIIERPIYLPQIDLAGAESTDNVSREIDGVTVTGTEYTSANIEGAAVFIANDATIKDRQGNPFEGSLSITEVPTALTPAALPEGHNPDLVVTIQPGEMVLDTPAPLTLPNRAGYAPGLEMDLWSINPTTGDFEIVGKGLVSDDGSVINTIEGGIRNSSWHYVTITVPELIGGSPYEEDPRCGHGDVEASREYNSDVTLFSGEVKETHELAGYSSLGRHQVVVMKYNSSKSGGQQQVISPTVSFEEIRVRRNSDTIVLTSRNEPVLVTKLSLVIDGVEQEVASSMSNPQDPSPELISSLGDSFAGNRYAVPVSVDLSDYDPGLYTYKYTAGLYFRSPLGLIAGSSSTTTGTILNVSDSDDSMGRGWGISGAQRLIENEDGSILVLGNDNEAHIYQPSEPGSNLYISPAGDFSQLERLPNQTFRRTTKTGTIYQFNANHYLTSITDRNGNETQHLYDDANKLTGIVDPVGLTTQFVYENGRVDKIIHPTTQEGAEARETRLRYDNDGNLIEIIDPDDKNRQFDYNSRHLMIEETDKRGNVERSEYDATGRAVQATRKDGSVVRVQSTQSVALQQVGLAAESESEAIVPSLEDSEPGSYFADANGNVAYNVLDRAGQVRQANDQIGTQYGIERNLDNLVTEVTDGKGNTTLFDYDDRGNITRIEETNVEVWGGSTPNPFFDAREASLLSSQYRNFKVGDLNNDSIADVVVENWVPSLASITSSVFLGNSDGTFSPTSIFNFNDSIQVLGDADQDGDLDIFGKSNTYINNGDASFSSSIIRSKQLPESSFLAKFVDINGDQRLDLVDVNDSDDIEIWLGDGTGDFALSSSYSVNSFQDIQQLEVADVDLDGDLDLLLQTVINTGIAYGTQQLTVYETDDNDTLNPLDPITFDSDQYQVADLSGDGKPDIISEIEGDLFVHLGNQDGTFQVNSDSIYSGSVDHFTIGNFDVDPAFEIAFIDDSSSEVSVLDADESGIFSQSLILQGESTSYFDLEKTDFDASNGFSDVIIRRRDSTADQRSLVSLMNKGSGLTLPEVPVKSRSKVEEFQYDPIFNQLIRHKDALGRVTEFELDDNGNTEKVIRIIGQSDKISSETDDLITQYKYTDEGLVEQVIDAEGRTTDYLYDDQKRLETIIFPLVETDTEQVRKTVSYKYDDAGNVEEVTDENQQTTKYLYDDLNRLETITEADPDGDGPLPAPVTAFQYDNAGNLEKLTDAENRDTLYYYDERGQLTRTTNPNQDDTSYTYDESGNLETVTDPRGNTTTYRYDSRNRRIASIDPEGGITRYEYDLNNNVTAMIDPRGHRTEYEYDRRDQMIGVTNANGDRSQFAYDIAGQLIAQTNFNQYLIQFAYDDAGRLTERFDPFGQTYQFGYDDVGNVTSETDERGLTTQFKYNSRNRLEQITNALNDTTEFRYDGVGNLKSVTDEELRTTHYFYDPLHRQTAVVDPNNLNLENPQLEDFVNADKTLFTYDQVGNLKSVTDARQHTTRYDYDALDRVQTVTNALGDTLTYGYDPNSNVTSVTDELGRITQFTYDKRNWQTEVIDPLGHTTTTQYDANGNATAVTNELGHRREYQYDKLNRLEVSIDAENVKRPEDEQKVTHRTYDAESNLTSLTDPEGNETTFRYDALNRLQTETNALNKSRHYKYDAASNLERSLDRNGREIEYVYDALNRLDAEKWLDGVGNVVNEIDFKYFADGQLKSVSDNDSRYTYQYEHPKGLLTSVSNAGTSGVPEVVFSYDYDAVNNLTSVGDKINGQDAGTELFTYDKLNRVERIEQFGNGVTDKRVDFKYDAASQMKSMTRYGDRAGNNPVVTSEYRFDLAGRLESLNHKRGNQLLAGYDFKYDAANRLTNFDSLIDGESVYTYSDRNELETATHDATALANELYDYDDNGNRTKNGDNENFLTEADNQLKNDGEYEYQYDDEGNRTQRIKRDDNDQIIELTEYQWDHRNRLLSVITTDANDTIIESAEYAYDAFDRRIRKTVDSDGAGAASAETERFVYDGEHIALVFDGDGDLTERFLHGPQIDQVLAQENADVSEGDPNRVLWALTDHQGSVRDVVNNDGDVVNHIVYDSFGNIKEETNSNVDFRFSYTGRELDEETGQYFYRARYYDSLIGQFINQDPIGFSAGDANLYRYVGNSPTNYTDPSGKVAFVPFLVAGGTSAAVDIAFQVAAGEGSFGNRVSNINWTSVAVSGATGAAGLGPAKWINRTFNNAWVRRGAAAGVGAAFGAGGQMLENILDGNCETGIFDGIREAALAGAAGEAVGEGADNLLRRAGRPLSRVRQAASDWLFGKPRWATAGGEGIEHAFESSGDNLAPDRFESSANNSSDYRRLRNQSPSQGMRDLVNNSPGPKTDPVYGYDVDKLEADHIVSLKEIVDMPGFDQLTPEQQLEVANLPENFMGLGKSTNSSKQDKTWSEWPGHRRLGPVDPNIRRQMIQRENQARIDLQRAINDRLGQ